MKNTLLLASLFILSATTAFTQSLSVNCYGYENGCGQTGPPNGMVFCEVNSGTAPYTYIWSTGAVHNTMYSNDSLFGLAGWITYTVTVTDANAATGSASYYVPETMTLDFAPFGVSFPWKGKSNGVINAMTFANVSPPLLSISLHSNTTLQNWGPDYFGCAPNTNVNCGNWDLFDSLPAGSYTATLTNATGCTGTFQVVLTEIDTPLYQFSYTTTPSCYNNNAGTIRPTLTVLQALPQNVNYQNSSFGPGIVPYALKFNFSLYDSSGNYIGNLHQFNDSTYSGMLPGLYLIHLKISYGDNVDYKLLEEKVYPVSVPVNNTLPQATITPGSSTVLCTGEIVSLNANTGNGQTFQWSKSGVPISGETKSVFKADRAGSYQVKVTKNGCSKTSSATVVSIVPLPTREIIQQPDAASGYDARITTATPAVNYGNDPGFEAASWQTAPYTVRSFVDFDKSAWPSWSNIRKATVSFYYNPTSPNYNGQNNGANASTLYRVTAPWTEPGITWQNQPAFTVLDAVNLPASVAPLQNYENIDVSEMIRKMRRYPLEGYGMMLKLVNEFSNRSLIFCSSDHADNARHPKLVLTVTGADVTTDKSPVICSGDSVKLTVSSGFIYSWKRNGNVISGALANYYYAKQAGTYKCVVSNTSGCFVVSQEVTVTVNALPTAVITPDGPTTFCTGDSVVLEANTGINFSYQWKKNNTTIAGAVNRKYTAKVAGSYKVKVTNATGCTKLSTAQSVSVPCREGEITAGENQFDVHVYPNPSSGEFTFEAFNTSEQKTVVDIYDAIGKKILSGVFHDSFFKISNSTLVPGVYSAVITNGKERKMVKVIKTN